LKIFIFCLLFLLGCNPKNESVVNSFSDFFNKKEEFSIKKFNDKSFSVTTNIIRLLKNKRLLIFDLLNGDVLITSLDGYVKTHIIIEGVSITSDIAADDKDNIYHLNPLRNMVKIYDTMGISLRTFRVSDGQKIYVNDKGEIFIYKTDFNIKFNRLAPTVFMYNNDGKFIKSFGLPPKNPNVDKLPIPGGSISSFGGKILISHSSDYIVNIYDGDSKLLKRYDRKPSFYYKLREFLNLKEHYITQWYETTLQWNTLFLNENTIVSHYMRVDKSKSWLFIQTGNKSIEIHVPDDLYFIGARKNRFLFLDTSQDKNLIKFIAYDDKKNIN